MQMCYLPFYAQNKISLFLSDFVNVYQKTQLKIKPQ